MELLSTWDDAHSRVRLQNPNNNIACSATPVPKSELSDERDDPVYLESDSDEWQMARVI